MKIINIDNKNLDKIKSSIKKGYSEFDSVIVKTTEKIVENVKRNGNKALFSYTKKFDRFDINSRNLTVKKKEIDNAVKSRNSY